MVDQSFWTGRADPSEVNRVGAAATQSGVLNMRPHMKRLTAAVMSE